MSGKSKPRARVSTETFDAFLESEGMLAQCEDHAIKEMIAEQVAAAMKAKGISKTEMARAMNTSRRQLDRLFDPAIPSVTLSTLARAASALGRGLRVELV
jgi:antitoxin HicB